MGRKEEKVEIKAICPHCKKKIRILYWAHRGIDVVGCANCGKGILEQDLKLR